MAPPSHMESAPGNRLNSKAIHAALPDKMINKSTMRAGISGP